MVRRRLCLRLEYRLVRLVIREARRHQLILRGREGCLGEVEIILIEHVCILEPLIMLSILLLHLLSIWDLLLLLLLLLGYLIHHLILSVTAHDCIVHGWMVGRLLARVHLTRRLNRLQLWQHFPQHKQQRLHAKNLLDRVITDFQYLQRPAPRQLFY